MWPYRLIRDVDIAREAACSDDARYSAVKRALKDGSLTRLRKGLYLITAKTKGELSNEFALSLYLCEPSFISLETALSHHGWIPEAVYVTTAVSPKRAQELVTPLGNFLYKRVPEKAFYLGVQRIALPSEVIFMAQPWRAVADYIYVYAKAWKSLADFEGDMRIDHSTLKASDVTLLKDLVRNYPSLRVKKTLELFLDELTAKKLKKISKKI